MGESALGLAMVQRKDTVLAFGFVICSLRLDIDLL